MNKSKDDDIVNHSHMRKILKEEGFTCSVEAGRLMLAE